MAALPNARRTIVPAEPIDLRLTLAPLRHGTGDPTIQLGPAEAWRATRTPEGPASLHLLARGGRIDVTGWGPGAKWAVDHSPELLGFHDDPTLFEPRHLRMRELFARLRGFRLARSRRVIEALVPTIIEQKITTAESTRSYWALVRRHGEPAPGPGSLLLPPDPRVLAALPYEDFHPLGIERRRADLVRGVCARAKRLEELGDLAPKQARSRLLALPGVGPWTAGHVERVVLGDPDGVITGDFHFPHTVSWTLSGRPRGSDELMLELLEPYRGQRGRAQHLIVVGAGRAPRRAPRRALRRLASM